MEIKIKRGLADMALYAMLGYAFFAPVSITIAEIFFILAMLILAVRVAKKELKFGEIFSTPMTLPIVVFAALHFINALFGVDMKAGLFDFRKVYLILIFFTAINVYTDVYPLRMGAGFFAGGAAFVGAWCVVNTVIQKIYRPRCEFQGGVILGKSYDGGRNADDGADNHRGHRPFQNEE